MNILNKYSKLSFVVSLYLYNKTRNNKLSCTYENNDKHKSVLMKSKTDLFIWGNGFINQTPNYLNFHPHRIKKYTSTSATDSTNNQSKLPDNIVDIEFSEYLSAAIDKNYDLFIWREPKLNAEKSSEYDNHTRNDIIKLNDSKIKVVNAKFTKDKLFILTIDGNVYMYNIDIVQDRGDDFFENSLPEPIISLEKNKLIHISELKNIKMIATGRDHFIALDRNGKLYGMGDDSFGQLGLGTFEKDRENQMKMYGNFVERRERLPKPIEMGEKIIKIVCGENHTLALSEQGNVYGFGYNRYLQLSNDKLYRQRLIGLSKPTIIPNDKFNNRRVVDIAASRNCSFFVCTDESDNSYHFYSAGEGLKGTLGQNLIKHMSDVESMPDISGLVNADTLKPFEPLKITCGLNHCLLLFKNPRMIYVWGHNEFGELGTMDRIFYESPVPMLEEYSLPYKILNISAGHRNSSFICHQVEKSVKNSLIEKDKQMFEEQMKELKKKRKKRRVMTDEEKLAKQKEKEKENNRVLSSLEQIYKGLRKYI